MRLSFFVLFSWRGFLDEPGICQSLGEVGCCVPFECVQLQPPVLAIIGHTVNGSDEAGCVGFHGTGFLRVNFQGVKRG